MIAPFFRSEKPRVTEARIRDLASILRTSLRDRFPASVLRVHDGDEHSGSGKAGGGEFCGIVSFSLAALPAAEVKERLAQLQPPIHVAVSPRRSTRWDSETRDIPDVVRVSLHIYNNPAEISELVDELARMTRSYIDR